MWIHVPKTYSASAPASEESSLDSEALSLLARSVTLRTNSVSPASLRRACRTAPWIQRLSGLTSAPSTQNRGVEKWISSEMSTHLQTQAITNWPTPNANEDRAENYTLETSQRHLDEGRQVHLAQVAKLGWATRNWPTPQARDHKSHDAYVDGTNLERKKAQGWTEDLNTKAVNWPTPNTRDTRRGCDQKQLATEVDKTWQNPNWPTPTTRDYKDGTSAETVPENGLLGRAAPNWANSRSSPQDPTTTQDGSGSSPDGPNSPPHTAKKDTMCSPKCRRLNQNFVCWLQGLPQGWVNSSAPLATGSFQSWQLRLIENLRNS